MKKLLAISGWLGKGKLKEYRRNRDNVDQHIIETINKLSHSFQIITDTSLNLSKMIDIELHFNVQRPRSNAKKVCLLVADPLIRPQNLLISKIGYSKVITWDRRLAKKTPGAIWVPYPYDLISYESNAWNARTLSFVMISSNRNVLFSGERSLYDERYKIIKFFEENHQYNFCLFGAGWEYPLVKSGVLSRIEMEFRRRTNSGKTRRCLRNWKGMIDSKLSVLNSARFNFCYENIDGIDGYVSEKIYDSINHGAIPIYIPSSSSNGDLIPERLYVDPRNFSTVQSLVDYCLSLSESDYLEWRSNALDFLSRNCDKLSTKKYANLVWNEIVSL